MGAVAIFLVIAASSGNSGHALAVVGSRLGYKVVIITNRKCSNEKCENIRKGGAELWMAEELPAMFPDELANVNCYMEQERILAQKYPEKYFSVNQYENFDNMMAHYEATAQEIWDQSKNQVTHFVMAASTGGSIMGVGKFLKDKKKDIRVVLSDPHKSHLAGLLEKARGNQAKGDAMLRKVEQAIQQEGSIQVEGAGKASLTKIMMHDGGVLKYVDEAITVHDFDAFDMCRKVAKDEGIMIGGSAGLNVVACRRLAERCVDEGTGNVVITTLLCDDGNKYKSKIFNDEWIRANDPRNIQQGHSQKEQQSLLPTASSRTGYRLDPQDWDAYRAQMHELLDACCDRMQSYREKPWQVPPADLPQRVKIETGGLGSGAGCSLPSVMEQLTQDIMPYATGNTHPQFMGWVHGAGLPSSVAADLVAATMNSNCGGRHQGANDVECACIDFLCQTAGFAMSTNLSGDITTPFGVLTGGTSQATIYALMAARTKVFGYDIRKTGISGLGPVRVYVSDAGHSCISRAMECIGFGSDSVVRIPINPTTGAMEIEALKERLEEDKVAGITPLAIVGTAGSVTVGAYDDFEALSKLAKKYNTWFHVDAAFGFWTRLSQDSKIRRLTNHIHLADSIALDAHKWPGVNYDCGALLVRDKQHLRSTMATRPAYLQSASEGLAGGETWFTDYSLDLSRGFRALKLWTALKTAGSDSIGAVVTDNCQLAAYMGRLVEKSPLLELGHPVLSNICCLSVKAEGVTAAEIAAELQLEGKGVFSTIKLGGVDCLRAALVNHRTTEDDIANVIASVEAAVTKKLGSRLAKDINMIPSNAFPPSTGSNSTLYSLAP